MFLWTVKLCGIALILLGLHENRVASENQASILIGGLLVMVAVAKPRVTQDVLGRVLNRKIK
jgi:hypothetical protein